MRWCFNVSRIIIPTCSGTSSTEITEDSCSDSEAVIFDTELQQPSIDSIDEDMNYHIRTNIGKELNLANWRIVMKSLSLNLANIFFYSISVVSLVAFE